MLKLKIRMMAVILFAVFFYGCEPAYPSTPEYFNKVADAIYLAENSTKYPYGIKSINTHGNKAYARKITIQTIINNWKRWEKDGKRQDYIDFLGDRYCPKSADPKGHAVWAKNVKYFLEKN